MSIKAKLLKRLEEVEKRVIPNAIDVMVFIEETEEKGIYRVQQNVHHGKDNYIEVWNVVATSAQEVADGYSLPEGCKEPLIFMYDFGDL